MKTQIDTFRNDREFIHPAVRFWGQIIWLVILTLAGMAYVSHAWMPRQPNAYEHGNPEGNSTDSQQPDTLAQSRSTVPPPTESSQRMKAASPPQDSQSVIRQSNWVKVKPIDPPTPPTDEVVQPRPKPTPQPVVAATAAPRPTQVSAPAAPRIVEGETAPYYTLESFAAIKAAAEEVGGRFLIVDGRFSVEFGKTLHDGSAMRAVDSRWHQIYARRMIPVPINLETETAIRRVAARYPQFKPAAARCYLGVPHQVDRMILQAQQAFLGDRFDVTLTTEVRLNRRACEVLRVLDGGQSSVEETE